MFLRNKPSNFQKFGDNICHSSRLVYWNTWNPYLQNYRVPETTIVFISNGFTTVKIYHFKDLKFRLYLFCRILTRLPCHVMHENVLSRQFTSEKLIRTLEWYKHFHLDKNLNFIKWGCVFFFTTKQKPYRRVQKKKAKYFCLKTVQLHKIICLVLIGD